MNLLSKRSIFVEFSSKLIKYNHNDLRLKARKSGLDTSFLINSILRQRNFNSSNKSKMELTQNSIHYSNINLTLTNNAKSFTIKNQNNKNKIIKNSEKKETNKKIQKNGTNSIYKSKDIKNNKNFIQKKKKTDKSYWDNLNLKNRFLIKSLETLFAQKGLTFFHTRTHSKLKSKTIVLKKKYKAITPTKNELFLNYPKKNSYNKVKNSTISNMKINRVLNLNINKMKKRHNVLHFVNNSISDKMNKIQSEFHSRNISKIWDEKEKKFNKEPKNSSKVSSNYKYKYKTKNIKDVNRKLHLTKVFLKKDKKNKSNSRKKTSQNSKQKFSNKKSKHSKQKIKSNFTEKKASINITLFSSMSEKEKNENIQINKIKTNYYVVNKPQETNMKYKIIERIASEETNEPVTKITIGDIEGYKDIMEKDKIINGSNTSINIDKSSSKIIITNESIDIERELVNLMKSKNNQKNKINVLNKK